MKPEQILSFFLFPDQTLPFATISISAFSDQLSASFCHMANQHPPKNDHLGFG
jgi:hypothetical protein